MSNSKCFKSPLTHLIVPCRELSKEMKRLGIITKNGNNAKPEVMIKYFGYTCPHCDTPFINRRQPTKLVQCPEVQP